MCPPKEPYEAPEAIFLAPDSPEYWELMALLQSQEPEIFSPCDASSSHDDPAPSHS